MLKEIAIGWVTVEKIEPHPPTNVNSSQQKLHTEGNINNCQVAVELAMLREQAAHVQVGDRLLLAVWKEVPNAP